MTDQAGEKRSEMAQAMPVTNATRSIFTMRALSVTLIRTGILVQSRRGFSPDLFSQFF
jgi:hypothetical protein